MKYNFKYYTMSPSFSSNEFHIYSHHMTLKIKTPAIISAYGKFIPAALYDELTIQTINERKIQILKTSGYKIPTNNKNPVYKVATALQKLRPNKFGAKISIEKNIPTFSGLGSQMSNAAGVLIALNKLWDFDLSQKELLKIAKQIDHKIVDILKIFFKPIKTKKIITLIRPKHIVIDKKWIKNRDVFKIFPDLKEIISVLDKMGAEKSGLSDEGSMLFGLFDKPVDKKISKEKIDFIWIGETCNKEAELIN